MTDAPIQLHQVAQPNGKVWPEWMDRKTTGEYLQISEWTVRNWTNLNILPRPAYIKTRRRWRRKELDEAMVKLQNRRRRA